MDNSETIVGMINKIAAGDSLAAQTDFNSLIADKLQAALDAKKVELANSVYGNTEVAAETETETEEETVENESEQEAQS